MLATLALLVAVGSHETPQNYLVQRSQDVFDSPTFHPHSERVTDPQDASKTVEAQVSYFFRYRIHEEDEPDDYEVVRTVRVRPERPVQTFQMRETRVGLSDLPDNADELRYLSGLLSRENVPTSNAPVFQRSMRAVMGQAVGFLSTTPTTVDPNQNLRAGGWTVREYGYDVWVTDVHIQLMKTVTVAGREPVTVPVGEEAIYELWEYWTPVPLVRERFIPDPIPGTMHANFSIPSDIGGVKFNDEYANLTGIRYVAPPRFSVNERVIGNRNLVASIDATKYMNRVFADLPGSRTDLLGLINLAPQNVVDLLNVTAAQGNDMNSLTVPNDLTQFDLPDCGSEIQMPPGTVWVPDRAGYQSMMNTTPLNVRFDFEANIAGGYVNLNTVRTHCLNKDLKEPEPGVRYFPFMSNDDVLVNLANLTNKSNFRGPWDQVRTWIYTDKLGLTAANKRISPPVSEGQYANGLFDVFKAGGFGEKDLANAELFEPVLLASAGTSNEAFKWLSMHMGEQYGKEVRKWIESAPSYLTEMVTSPRTDYEKEQPIRLVRSLLASSNVETRIGALNFLDKLASGEETLKDKFGDLQIHVHSLEAAEAAIAKKVAARYVSQPSRGEWRR